MNLSYRFPSARFFWKRFLVNFDLHHLVNVSTQHLSKQYKNNVMTSQTQRRILIILLFTQNFHLDQRSKWDVVIILHQCLCQWLLSVLIMFFFNFNFFCSEITETNKIKKIWQKCYLVLCIICDFRFIGKFNMATRPVMLADWLKFKISYSQNQQMLWNCFMVRMFLIWPSVKLINFLLMGNIGKMASAAGQSCKIWLWEYDKISKFQSFHKSKMAITTWLSFRTKTLWGKYLNLFLSETIVPFHSRCGWNCPWIIL